MTRTSAALGPSCAKHTCNAGFGPAFGRKTAGCPRCDELLAGAAPRKLRWVERVKQRQHEQEQFRHDVHHHYASGECKRTCGPVCVRFDA